MKIMKVLLLICSLFLFGWSLSGCDSARKAFGNKKNGPDEFLVYSRPPLSQPPDYRLRPPKPGKQSKQISTVNQAKTAILGQTASKNTESFTSPGMEAVLRATGALTAKSTIRKIINEETSIYSQEDQRFVDKLLFWIDDKPYEGSVIDPSKEQKRIREARALGKRITEGQTIHIKRKRRKKGLLDF